MDSLLHCVRDIKITVTRFNDLFTREKDFIYFINKYNFTTVLDCADKHCDQASIHDELFEIIQNRITRHSFLKLCDGKDMLGQQCLAGWDVVVEIRYLESIPLEEKC